ncbi:MAG: NAD-dependent epimerase/dehydratase family protein [bacterium]
MFSQEHKIFKPTRWVITGGAGFLGTNFLAASKPEDGEIVVISRHPPRWPVRKSWIKYIEHDAREVDGYKHELNSSSVVIHMANSSYPGKAEKVIESDIQDNVLGTLRLAQACVDQGVANFVFLSSGGAIYGNQPHALLAENDCTFPISAYGAMKLTIEHYLRIIHSLHGLTVTLLRVSNPFGPWHKGTGQGAVNVFLSDILKNRPIEIWGEGNQIRDYIPVEDVVRAIREAGMEITEGCEVFNIGTGCGHSLNELLCAIEKVTGISSKIVFKPLRRVDVASNILNCEKAKERLGWQSDKSFYAALEETWHWTKINL